MTTCRCVPFINALRSHRSDLVEMSAHDLGIGGLVVSGCNVTLRLVG